MTHNQKIFYKNKIGTIYENTIIFSKIPNKAFYFNEISQIRIKEVKLKIINDILYSLVVILLFFDLYFHYSGIINTTIRETMFMILIIAINFKLKNKQIKIVDKFNREIKIPLKNKDYDDANKFINEYEIYKNKFEQDKFS